MLQNGCAVHARGFGQQVRGLKHRQHRPSRIVADDVDDKQIALNPAQTRKIFETFKDTYFPALGRQARRVFIFVSNKFSPSCVMARCLDDTDGRYLRHIAKAVSSPQWDDSRRQFTGGTPLWPEYYSLEDLSEIRDAVGEDAFEAEYQNNPDQGRKKFPLKYLRRYRPANIESPLVYYLGVDPSWTTDGDYKAQILVGTDGRRFFVRYAHVRQESDNAMIEATYGIHRRFGPVKIVFETEGLQHLYLRLYRDVALGRSPEIGGGRYTDVHLPLVPLKHGGISKIARIGSLSSSYERGSLLFAEGEDVGDMDVLIEQLREFPTSTVNDDGPDALQMAESAAQEMAYLEPRIETVVRGRWTAMEHEDRAADRRRGGPRERGRFGVKRGLFG